MSSDERDISNEQAIAIANAVPSLRPIGGFSPEERKQLAELDRARMEAYYADLTERQNERYAREHLADLCQALVQRRQRLLPYYEPDRLVVAALQAMQQRLPGPMFLGPLTGERLDAAIVEQVSIHFGIPIETSKAAMRVIKYGLGDEVLVGRITLSEAHERVRAKEEEASAKATDASAE
jgi:hypothetical protein